MSRQPLSYLTLAPQPHFDDPDYKIPHFMETQPRVLSAISDYLHTQAGQALVLKCEQVDVYGQCLRSYICSQYPIEDDRVVSQLYYTQHMLFGRVHNANSACSLEQGLVHHAKNGVLILGVEPLIQHPHWWFRLKSILLTQVFHWELSDKSNLPYVPPQPLTFKLILLGSREQLASLYQLDETLYAFSQYSEIEHYLDTSTPERLQQWGGLVQYLSQQIAGKCFDAEGLTALYQLGVRESEDAYLQPIALPSLTAKIEAISAQCQQDKINQSAVWNYFRRVRYQQSSLSELSQREFINQHIFIETDGQCVGQVNGLSVVEYAGTPISFGEPSRITCTVQLGEGEITDVERKNDLAGNVHSKGTMLAQYCLAHLLHLPAQLPFAAAIVFEQSYADIDGDSASLAQFCALVSALADVPIFQHIAITGAIDQSGHVHSVGGVNQKIEGFFHLCQHRGLTGQQGVIIPQITQSQLSLQPDIIDAVKAGQFHIWGVENVEQALAILTALPLFDEQSGQSLSELISTRLESIPQSAVKQMYHAALSLLTKLKK
ncbi:AAA family ATPase [Spirabiliibacterium falconis]|uniref:AAA family ATPase n=1 Tax=Spirabiliibacterium falconis TaxID=572023 RepID=UPI001AACF8DD|nr:AAA family ATPase [Spirabiliibacterium falconis]MBE2894178.1 AAA family ATPase [Spirabiliibacterium falconis]